MIIGIIGLGLIGGSLARATARYTTHTCYGSDANDAITLAALHVGVIAAPLTDERIAQCDLVVLALQPGQVVPTLEKLNSQLKPGAIVIDVAGIKSTIYAQAAALVQDAPWHFIPAHPMAGKAHNGWANSEASLYQGASLLLCPYPFTPAAAIEQLTQWAQEIGFASTTTTTPDNHDRRIAYTSQLAHVVSSAYANDPLIDGHLPFSAGSFADMTRVATIDPGLWADLFRQNKAALAPVLGGLIERLQGFADALQAPDSAPLQALIAQGSIMKSSHAPHIKSPDTDFSDLSVDLPPETDLSQVRTVINDIDDQLMDLFVKRINIVQRVAQCKRASGKPVLDPARERAILTRVSQRVGPELESHASLFFSTLFNVCRARQRSLLSGPSPLRSSITQTLRNSPKTFPTQATVACQGTEGAYSQIACSQLFPLPTILYFKTFDDVFHAVEKGLCRYGVLPIENATSGSVTQIYDLMVKHRFNIVREARLHINHVLLARPGITLDQITHVISHPHALSQCQAFLKEHPEISATPVQNTATAAKQIASDPEMIHTATISSPKCAELYNLDVLAENISTVTNNYTRFICISKAPEIYPQAHKITIRFALTNKPGSLHTIIAKFAAIGINLTKLESRPILGMDFEFSFTMDLDATIHNPQVVDLLAELDQDPDVQHFTFLGAY